MVDQAELSVRAANDDEPPLCSLLFRSTPPLPRSEGGLSALDVRERLPSETAPSRSSLTSDERLCKVSGGRD